jgi:prepilin-type N-terminal cleavage/methylation domain-containing protein
MKKMLKKALKGFTLVELIVVIAIIAILSTVGFVSYTGYIRDSRNAVRDSDLSEATNVITQFIAQNGRAPRCASDTGSGGKCYFAKDGTLSTTGETAGDAVAKGGIATGDWDGGNGISGLNVTKAPMDPKKVYYVYVSKGDKFAIYATREDSNGYSSIIRGSDNFDQSVSTDVQLAGFAVTNGTIGADGTTIQKNGDPASVPYKPAANAS